MSLLSKIKKIPDLFNKVSVFYNTDSANYWHTVTPCRISQKPGEIGFYFLDFSSKAAYSGKMDSKGVPLFEYPGEIPSTYHPVVICQYAMGLFDQFAVNSYTDNNIKEKFLVQANWLINNAVLKGDGAYWYFDFPDRRYGIKEPWISAMAQGEAISVLCRAYKITGNSLYLNTAKSALLPFYRYVSNGGVRKNFKEVLLFEEYPADEITGVLNGFIFSLFGIYDLALTLQDGEALKLFSEGITNLKLLLKYYDLGYWTRYDLFRFPLKNPASYTYHMLHVEQLKALYILTGENIFKEYSEKWRGYEKGITGKSRALINKIIYLRKIKAI